MSLDMEGKKLHQMRDSILEEPELMELEDTQIAQLDHLREV